MEEHAAIAEGQSASVEPRPAIVKAHAVIAKWLFLALFAWFAFTSSGRVRVIDEALALYQTESRVTNGSTAVPQAVEAKNFYGKFDREGNPRAPYPPGQAMASVPWFLLGKHVLARLPGVPEAAQNVTTDFGTVLSSAFLSALAATLAFLILTQRSSDVRGTLWATALFAFATPVWAYSAYFYSEPLALVLLLAAAYVLFPADAGAAGAAAANPSRLTWLDAASGGALLGIALWVRPTHLVVVPIFLLALLAARWRHARGAGFRTAIIVACVVGFFGAAYLWRNYQLFGSALDFGYPDVAEHGRRLNTFETPWYIGLIGFLFSPGKSVFLFAPAVILALRGIPALWRTNRGLAMVAAGAPLAYLALYCCYTQWEGGYCVGPRYLLPGIALLCLALRVERKEVEEVKEVKEGAEETSSQWRSGDARGGVKWCVMAVLVLGAGVNAVSMATSFLDDQARGGYYDAQFNYDLSYSPLTRQLGLALDYASGEREAVVGRGWDRWFVFLGHAGVAWPLRAGIAAVQLAALALALARMRRALRPASTAASGRM